MRLLFVVIAMLMALPLMASGTSYIFVAAPRCGPSHPELCKTPEDKARLAREKAEMDRKAAQAKQEQEQRDTAINGEMNRLGLPSHRRAEAERLLEMQRASEKARGITAPAANRPKNAGEQWLADQADAAAAAKKRRQEADAAREAREKAQAEAKKKHEEDLKQHLAAERSGIRLRALKCGGQDTVTGIRPAVSPRIANCIMLNYEARCPGVPSGQGINMSFYNFVGGDSCYGDTQRLPVPLGCKPETAIVAVRSVAVCN